MPGWNLHKGECLFKCQNEDDFWIIINNCFSNKTYKTTSYKYCFFKSIIDNVFNININNEIDFVVLFERFAEIYWNLIVKYGLKQIQETSSFSKSSIELYYDTVLSKYPIDKNTPYESLSSQIKKEIVQNVTKICSKYVVGAFYMDTDCSFYSFDKQSSIIRFDKNVVEYIIKFKSILGKMNYFEWIKFLEKTNPEQKALALAEKLDCSSKRGDLSYYRSFLQELYGESKCFYCNKNLLNKKIEMDHFIPWSFIKDDKIWNMVISCRECNNSKRDKLPKEELVDKLVDQNKQILSGPFYGSGKKEYSGYSEDTIRKIYRSAKFNGYTTIWDPNDKK